MKTVTGVLHLISDDIGATEIVEGEIWTDRAYNDIEEGLLCRLEVERRLDEIEIDDG